jgi:K+ transporter
MAGTSPAMTVFDPVAVVGFSFVAITGLVPVIPVHEALTLEA